MPAYYMSKTETKQWYNDDNVQKPNKMKSELNKCRDLIRAHAKRQMCREIVDTAGRTVEEV